MMDSITALLQSQAYFPDTGERADPAADLRLASALLDSGHSSPTSVLAPLTDQGVIRASGPEAADFLQNLLTNDVKNLPSDETRLAGFCTPKGRLLALFHIWRDTVTEGDVLLMLPREILPAMLKKLSMYVLRSKVKLSDATGELALWGWAGSSPNPSDAPRGTAMLRLNRTEHPALSLCVAPLADLAEWGPTLFADRSAIGLPAWHWLQVAAGVPTVVTATQEAFVPQMLNMELLAVAGISFSKGCYPGQEIVARTQYLGKIKRRMYHARLAGDALPGTPVFAPDTGDQPCGSVVSVARAPNDCIEALVCVQSGAVDGGEVRLGTPDGPAIVVLELPYSLDGPDTRQR